eukprot:c27844_g1_i2 orf=809-3991(-)
MTSQQKTSCHFLSKQTRTIWENLRKHNDVVSIAGLRATEEFAITFEQGPEIRTLALKLLSSDYYIYPDINELAAREWAQTGYCSRVQNFVVGRKGYGSVMFLGETDIRWLDLERIIRFDMCEVSVYEDEEYKPPVGQGLNKPAEVTLLNIKCRDKKAVELVSNREELKKFKDKLRRKTEEQGAEFVSYDSSKQQWKFRVKHFSRFGLDDSDDEEGLHPGKDLSMSYMSSTKGVLHRGEEVKEDDTAGEDIVGLHFDNEKLKPSDTGLEDIEVEGSSMDGFQTSSAQTALPHSLPAQLGLDPVKMQQMRTILFHVGEEAEDIAAPRESDWPMGRSHKRLCSTLSSAPQAVSRGQDMNRFHIEVSVRKGISSKHLKTSPRASWQRLPFDSFGRQASLELGQDVSPAKPSRLLQYLESKCELFYPERSRIGFKQVLSSECCVSGSSGYLADAALLLGNSFRVGWGPHGTLVHCGTPVGQMGLTNSLSSLINIEKVALDASVRDEHGKARDDFVELQFICPLKLHMSMSKAVQHSGLGFRYLVCDQLGLLNLCSEYEDLIVKQHFLEGLSPAHRLVLRHQVMVWHLLSVLFSEKVAVQDLYTDLHQGMERLDKSLDFEAEHLLRRAEFSSWLQDSVNYRIQDELLSLEVNDYLREIFILLTGRQLDDAVQLAALKGDVRLAILLSQAGGAMTTRKDLALQLDIWSKEGLDCNLIEEERLRIYQLLSGDVQGALGDWEIDWKRFLGLLMWYNLAPDTKILDAINIYSQLVAEQTAPQPIPMYMEEKTFNGVSAQGLYDISYYLMLLHASKEKNSVDVHKMLSSFSSTYDALDHRLAWLLRGFLQAIGVLCPLQLHVLDMNFVSQLLSIGLCHWAIYAVLHMPPSHEYPGLHEIVIREILNQYCEVWSTKELQQSFLENDLGIPSEWLHEALAIYWNYTGDSLKVLEHCLKSLQWHRAHSLFMKSVAASLFVNNQHAEIMKIATELETWKAELENWDLGGGIYLDFYVLKHSFQNNDVSEDLGLEILYKFRTCLHQAIPLNRSLLHVGCSLSDCKNLRVYGQASLH